MAHFRRRKPSVRTRARFADSCYWLRWTPRWWKVQFHRRPKRREEAALLRDVMAGRVDADEAAWPVASSRPHRYYW